MKSFSSNNSFKDIKIVKAARGILSWAHPLNSPEKINDEFALFLKQNGVENIEGNYQYLNFPKEYIKEIKPIIFNYIGILKGFYRTAE